MDEISKKLNLDSQSQLYDLLGNMSSKMVSKV